jgi:hypothetical protein
MTDRFVDDQLEFGAVGGYRERRPDRDAAPGEMLGKCGGFGAADQ